MSGEFAPIGGSYVKINPHPGCVRQKITRTLLFRQKIEEAPHEGYGQLESISFNAAMEIKGVSNMSKV